MERRSTSIYYGWYVTAAFGLILMIVVGATMSAFGLFVLPVSREFGLSRAEVNSAFILLNIGIAVMAPFIGRALDRFPAKRIMLLAILCLGAGLAVLSVSRSLWLSGLAMLAPLPIAFLAAGHLTYSIVLARWFTVQRGKAIMLAQMGAPIGSITVVPVIAWLIAAQGWRTALAITAALATVILLALLAIIRERPCPGESEVKDGSAGMAKQAPAFPPAEPVKVTRLLGTRLFWLTALSYALPMSMAQAMAVTLIPLAIENGIAMTEAVTLLSIGGGAAIIGNLGVSIIADKLDRVRLLILFMILGAVMAVLPLVGRSYVFLAMTSAIIGVSTGTMAPMFYALMADRFGVASFGTARGLIQPISAVMGALAVRFAGEVFDRTGHYTLLFQVMIMMQLMAAVLLFASRSTPRAKPGETAVAIATEGR